MTEATKHKKFWGSKVWQDFAKSVIVKHGKCDKCGALKEDLHWVNRLGLHHLNPDDYTALKEEDFAVLCWPCHNRADAYSRRKDRATVPDEWKPFLTRIPEFPNPFPWRSK